MLKTGTQAFNIGVLWNELETRCRCAGNSIEPDGQSCPAWMSCLASGATTRLLHYSAEPASSRRRVGLFCGRPGPQTRTCKFSERRSASNKHHAWPAVTHHALGPPDRPGTQLCPRNGA